ncbi:hypothetical protein IscW_ISCW021421 [Ixodes scapularis]|uniref:Uncharacterized protein n=1 Tax=Ixodes scapularis TaxID=6945 RepID=B7Q622_IXOSC|nr:hypothetical protein IscW_ISCW021421 [Ixodes scapularis]|eukprot:XP_002411869.1 hypothetical protein IscW_ISCW021421 [Ixodes scapularis]
MERGFLSEQDGFQSNTGATVDGPAVFARDSGIRPRPIASLAKDRCVQLACAPGRTVIAISCSVRCTPQAAPPCLAR